jgi:UDP-N-acetylglucosamine 2-epimerase (non-hydrolysing)
MKVILVAGARPNFMKIAPLMQAIGRHNASSRESSIVPILVHTGQHYDYEMSQVFFHNLELPRPDIHLGVGSGTHAEQTGKIMMELEKVLLTHKPDVVVVVGDVNSTLAAALTAVKLHIPVAHVEAGLRSFDQAMPEEINRLLTDALSDYLFTHSPDANENLEREGIPQQKIFLVGNVMVDSLLCYKPKAEQSQILRQLGLTENGYALLTLHRPSNVDEKESLLRIIKALEHISREVPIVFPAHPRSQKNIAKFGFSHLLESQGLIVTKPLGYLDFLKLEVNAKFVMTDSGGIQEETTVFNIPCLTLRDTTERPITVTQGTNTLVGNNSERIITEASKILNGKGKRGCCPELWDGKAAARIIRIITTGENDDLQK